jgi:hypothetical protein
MYCTFTSLFLHKFKNCIYEVTDTLQIFFPPFSLKSSVTDWVFLSIHFIYLFLFFFAFLRQHVCHCCPLPLVQFTVPEDMFLRL